MSQYFVAQNNIKDGRFAADLSESRHIMKVSRHRIGDEIKIFDGKGGRYSAVIDSFERGMASGSIKNKIISSSYKIELTLCFSPVSKTAIEEILEHCAETGVSAFQPVICERTQGYAGRRNKELCSSDGQFNLLDKWMRKKERFNQILLSASKQSERAFIPELRGPARFDDVFEDGDIVFLASPEGNSLKNCGVNMENIERAKVVIGPEGGFTDKELSLAKAKKAVFIKISKHILRSETASIAASSLILNLAEEVGLH